MTDSFESKGEASSDGFLSVDAFLQDSAAAMPVADAPHAVDAHNDAPVQHSVAAEAVPNNAARHQPVAAQAANVQAAEHLADEQLASELNASEQKGAVDEAVAEEPAAPNRFIALGLAPELLQAVQELGFTQPTTVQEQTIPLALPSDDQGDAAAVRKFNDLMVSSQTGSGKTAAFLLPVLHTLLRQQKQELAAQQAEFERLCAEAIARGEPAPKRAKRKDPTNPRHFKAAVPGALILCPTRELAQQVAHDAIDLVRHCRGLRIANVVGGMPYQVQIAQLQNANLVVATPGRLLDLQRSMHIKLDKVQFLVVDEADRMLDLGFSDDLAEINQLCGERQQTMMFSATFAPRIQQLAMRVMRPGSVKKIQIDNPQEKHVNIKQVLFWADNSQHKRKLLDHWLRDSRIDQAIVFASTQIECDGLATDLQQEGFSAVALHGALSQGLRNRRLMALRRGDVQILVATDVAARGIDVPTITHVFNYGLPMKAEDYTHRIGRTGRAGRDGLAVTFAEFRDRRKIFDIEAYSKQPIATEVIPGMEPQQRPPQVARGLGDRGSRDRRGAGRSYGSGGASKRFGEGGGAGGYGKREQREPSQRSFGGAGYEQKSFENPRRPNKDSYQNNSAPRFAPRDGAARDFAPRDGGARDFAPRGGRDVAQRDGAFREGGRDFAPRDFAPREGGAREFTPRNGAVRDFAKREGASRRGDFAADRRAPAGHAAKAGKVFVPRDAIKKRPAKTAR